MTIELNLSWQGGMQGTGIVKGSEVEFPISIPTVYGGKGTGSNPKELYVASTAACFLATLSAISDNKKLPVAALNVATKAVEGDEGFTIHHTAFIALAPQASDADKAKALEYVATADKICAVGNLARKAGVDVTATAEVTIAAAQTEESDA